MADSLTLVSDLEVRLRLEVGSLDGADLAAAEAAIEDASELAHAVARDAGLATAWTLETVPKAVRVIVTRCARREFRNPDGFQSESMGSGAYSYAYASEETSAYLTDSEAATITAEAVAAAADTATGFTGSVRTPSGYAETSDPEDPTPWWW